MARPSSQATSGQAEVVAGEEIASGDDRLPGEESMCESETECREHPRARSLPWEEEEGDLWVGPCTMNRTLPDVDVREEATSRRENIVCKTQSSWRSVVAGWGGGGGGRPTP